MAPQLRSETLAWVTQLSCGEHHSVSGIPCKLRDSLDSISSRHSGVFVMVEDPAGSFLLSTSFGNMAVTCPLAVHLVLFSL